MIPAISTACKEFIRNQFQDLTIFCPQRWPCVSPPKTWACPSFTSLPPHPYQQGLWIISQTWHQPKPGSHAGPLSTVSPLRDAMPKPNDSIGLLTTEHSKSPHHMPELLLNMRIHKLPADVHLIYFFAYKRNGQVSPMEHTVINTPKLLCAGPRSSLLS